MRDRWQTRAAMALAALALIAGCAADREADTPVPGCGEGSPVARRPLRIAASVAPITNLVSLVAGGDAEVVGIVPEGRNSHTFEPAPSAVAALESADIVFLNGLSLEVSLREMAVANLGAGGELCELGEAVLPVERYIYDFSFPESGGSPNPHLWTNPPMARQYTELIRDVLVTRDPGNADRYRSNAEVLISRIDELDAAVRIATATIPAERRLLLTYHDAYAYFADEYGWTVLGAVQPSSFDEPTPREVADLIRQVRSSGVPAVFGSEVFPSPVLRQIAAETGARYVDDLRDDDLPGRPGEAGHSWLALMQFNYVTIVEAFGGDAAALRSLDPVTGLADEADYP